MLRPIHFTGIMLQPWPTSNAWPSPRYTRFLVYPALRAYLAIALLLQYSGTLDCLPSLGYCTDHFPWNATPYVRFFVGLLPRSYAPFLLPMFGALLIAALAARQANVDEFEAKQEALRPPQPPFLSAAEALMGEAALGHPHPHPTGAMIDAGQRRASHDSTLAAVHDLLSPTAEPGSSPAGRLLSAWDALQVFVCTWSEKVVLILVFLLSAAQARQNVLVAGYFVTSLLLLLHPQWLRARGNALWGWVRLYNYAALLVQALYQLPWATPPPSCFGAADTGPCLSWESFIGLRKMLVEPVPGWPGCASSCPSPFSFWLGMGPSLTYFALLVLQVG